MKNRYTIAEDEDWKDDAINRYVKQFKVLVLFRVHSVSKEVELIIHGDFSIKKKKLLLIDIIRKYGGKNLSPNICVEINDFAEKWYNKYVSEKRARVINFKKK